MSAPSLLCARLLPDVQSLSSDARDDRAKLRASRAPAEWRIFQHVNRRHRTVGQLFQGRYKAILVQKEAYLLELSRYIVLNPLWAKMVDALEAWPWSSYQYYMGDVAVPVWLECDWLLGRFGTRRSQAITAYRNFVLAGIGKASPLSETRHQVLLGEDDFIAQHQQLQRSETLAQTVRIKRAAVALSLTEYRRRFPDRAEAMARAYLSTALTMTNIAHAFDMSVQTVSRAVRIWEGRIVRR
jgi:putative transposase